jgi:hypothetical protein
VQYQLRMTIEALVDVAGVAVLVPNSRNVVEVVGPGNWICDQPVDTFRIKDQARRAILAHMLEIEKQSEQKGERA